MAAPLPKSVLNTLVVGQETYKLTIAYIRGAMACRDDVPTAANPYDTRNQIDSYDDWNFGYEHELQGEHYRFDQDVLKIPKEAQLIELDPEVPRTKQGVIKPAWLKTQRKRFLPKKAA